MKQLKNVSSLIIAAVLVSISLIACEKEAGWDVTVRGKVGFPQQGAISIQEMKPDGTGVKEPITLSKNYTFEKKLRLTSPGYYRLSFYDKQFVMFILHQSDVDVNVDGNKPDGFVEIKGSPDQDLINKVQTIINPSVAINEREYFFIVFSINCR